MSVWCGSRWNILMQYYATSGHVKCLVMLNDNPALSHTELHFLKKWFTLHLQTYGQLHYISSKPITHTNSSYT